MTIKTNRMKKIVLGLLVLSFSLSVFAQEQPLSEKLSATAMHLWKDSMAPKGKAVWNYEQAVILKGIEKVWKHTGNGQYFSYIQKSTDFFVDNNGTIRTYKPEEYSVDNIPFGRTALMLYNVTEKEKYKKAADQIREQLKNQPRTKEGGFWHKKRYPSQMWLDGLYMGEPFYAKYAKTFNEPSAFDDIANQFIWMEQHARDTKTGLLYHGWDESKEQKWADKTTGCSANFWGRGMGWYGMGLVDVLESFPVNHPKRKELINILNRYAEALVKVQDTSTGLWWQVLDKGNEKGNYLEASASSMFVYTLAKGVRLGYIDNKYLVAARKAYAGIIKNFIFTDTEGFTHLNHICQVAGLGGNPYRDGSYDYYISEPIVTDDPKGLGACVMAAVEMETDAEQTVGKGKNVTLDYYFNNEWHENKQGVNIRYHYIWEDLTSNGFSLWGNIFSDYGASLSSLDVAPTAANLNKSDVYIIVDPDNVKDNPHPNYIQKADIDAIVGWVKKGGVLVLMANDSANCEFTHLNELSNQFGINFSYKSRNMVKNNRFETGAIYINTPQPVFAKTKKVYLKEISILNTKQPAQALITNDGDIIMAVAKLGKGTVFAVGDPWLYNEYTDGRKIPAEIQNFSAAKELAKWLLQQVKH